MRKLTRYSIPTVVALFIVAQFIRPDRGTIPANRVAGVEASSNVRPEAVAVFQRACRDCHSYDTVWPWYSRIAPVSWLVADDVRGGRSHLNLSEWSLYSPEMAKLRIKEACSEVTKGDMPLWYYTLVHPQAKLSKADVETICGALREPGQ